MHLQSVYRVITNRHGRLEFTHLSVCCTNSFVPGIKKLTTTWIFLLKPKLFRCFPASIKSLAEINVKIVHSCGHLSSVLAFDDSCVSICNFSAYWHASGPAKYHVTCDTGMNIASDTDMSCMAMYRMYVTKRKWGFCGHLVYCIL